MTIEDLLKMKVKFMNQITYVEGEHSPEFRVAVQDDCAHKDGVSGVHVIIQAYGHDSATIDLFVSGNSVKKMF